MRCAKVFLNRILRSLDILRSRGRFGWNLASGDLLGVKVNWRHIVFTGEILESLSLGLWNEETSEDTGEHECGVDLHDMVEPRVSTGLVWAGGDGASGSERCNGCLGND